jgi:tRNA threonylcarbamoyladenosine biosynthesis protein TsaE
MELNISNVTLMEQLALGLKSALRREKLKSIIVFLKGDLGAGKTTWVQSFIQSLGIQDPITSPTYTLVESYESSAFNIHHFDLYRLNDPNELELIGIRDYFSDEAFCLIEWPEKGEGVLPTADLVINILIVDETSRKVQIDANTNRGERILQHYEKSPFG